MSAVVDRLATTIERLGAVAMELGLAWMLIQLAREVADSRSFAYAAIGSLVTGRVAVQMARRVAETAYDRAERTRSGQTGAPPPGAPGGPLPPSYEGPPGPPTQYPRAPASPPPAMPRTVLGFLVAGLKGGL